MVTKRQKVAIGLGIAGATIGVIALINRAKGAEWEPPLPEPGLANVYGTVTDKVTGEPILGVGVWLWGTGRETVTDSQGRYVLKNILPANYTIAFPKVGYVWLERIVFISVGNNKIDAALQSFVQG